MIENGIVVTSYLTKLKAARAGLQAFLSERARSKAGREYHLWFFNSYVWKEMRWFGVPIYKLPFDLWNYQEILTELRPSLVIEFGSAHGGSALYFSQLLRSLGQPYCVLSVDVDADQIASRARQDPNIVFLHSSSADPKVAEAIVEWRTKLPGPVFAILDSDHSKKHVLAEMELLRPVLKPGDYMVVEDGNINGHPVLPDWGEGPFEAVEEYMRLHPEDYSHDREREKRFGLTFAPNGYLIRR
jgi:cephalosporin hydroxylase